jgi:hypothetical protein
VLLLLASVLLAIGMVVASFALNVRPGQQSKGGGEKVGEKGWRV